MIKKILLCLFFAVILIPTTFARGPREEVSGEEVEMTVMVEGKYKESPMLAERVKQGLLPAVDQRLPKNPAVVKVVDQIGKYGGTLLTAGGNRFVAIDSALAGRFTDQGPFTWDINAGELQPNWVEDAFISDDGMLFTIMLREGIKWSDGTPMTTDDLLFSYQEVGFNEELNAAGPPGWLKDVKFEQVDQYELRMRLPNPSPFFVYTFQTGGVGFSQPISPKHYFSQFHPNYAEEDDLAAAAKEAGLDTWTELFALKQGNDNMDRPNLHLWVLAESTSERVVAERNPYFWKVDEEGNQLPYIDRMRYDILASGEVVAMKGMAGELDLQFYNVNFGDFPTLKDNEKAGGYEVYTWRSMGGRSSIAFNLNFTGDPEVAGMLRNADFRKALSIAIDRDEVNELVYLGQGNAVQISPPLGAPDYNAKYPAMYAEYDPAKAKRMLDEIGLKDTDGDGFRELPSGKKFTLWYITESDLKEYVDTGELVKGYWEDVGVKVDFEPMALDLENQVIDAGEFMCRMSKIDIIVFPLYFDPNDGFMGRFSPTDYRTALQWENWLRNDAAQGEKPTPEYQEAHDYFTQIITSTDSSARIEASRNLWDNYYENLWGIGIIQELPFPLIVKNTVKNVPKSAANAWPLRTPSNAGLAQWYLEKE